MKILKIFCLLAALILSVSSFRASAQVYTYTWSGALTGCYSEIDLSVPTGAGGYTATAASMSETITYNVAAQTVNEAGTVTFSNPSATVNMYGPFNQPGVIIGNETLAINNGGVVSFDTTSSLYVGNGNAFFPEIDIPVSVAGTVSGQSFSGNFSMDLPFFANITSASPTAFSFTQVTGGGGTGYGLSGEPTGIEVAGYDLENDTSDTTYQYGWNQTVAAPAIAAVPEPGTFTLFGLGLSTSAFWLRKPKAARLI